MEVIRTPEERFENLPGYPFAPNYVEIELDGWPSLRMHYVDEGPRDATPILMLHGEPTWSYLYRKLIPIFAAAGFRALAPDHIGFGRSDKLVDKTLYSFESHVAALQRLVQSLDLKQITLLGQDWGGPIGLAVLAREPDRFARAVAANTMLHTVDPELSGRVAWANHSVGQQEVQVAEGLLAWILHSQRSPVFEASTAVDGTTVRDVAQEVLAAYDAPFPDERYKAGMRQFPALIPLTPTDSGAQLNRTTWDALSKFEKPFLTLFGDTDPGTAGWEEIFQERVPGSRGQPHGQLERTGHFLQEDAGEELAERILAWMA